MNERTVSRYEKLRYKFLSDEEAEVLYSNFPGLRYAPSDWCVSCNKDGSECDCYLELQVRKHLVCSGMPPMFQYLSWTDYEGDSEARNLCKVLTEQSDGFLKAGIGLFFIGDVGRGKTMALSLVCKDLIAQGREVFFTTFQDLIDSRFKTNEQDKEWYNSKVNNSEFLVIDDIGKEEQREYGPKLLDNIFRRRSQSCKSTSVSANLTQEEVKKTYGNPFWSLVSQSTFLYEFSGKDFRLEDKVSLIKKLSSRKSVLI